MSKRWKLGGYTFTINPNKYSEQLNFIGDRIVTLDGTVISAPTTTEEAYSFTSIFFQHRPKVLSEMSIGQANGIKYVGDKIYALDDANDLVRVYSTNFVQQKTIPLKSAGDNTAITFSSFTVETSEIIYAVEKTLTTSTIYRINGTNITSKVVSGLSGSITGIDYHNGYLWVCTTASKLYKLDLSYNIMLYANLPYIHLSANGYRGITSNDEFIIVSYGNGETSGVYFINSEDGSICNNFYLPSYEEIIDVDMNGEHYVFLLDDLSTIKTVRGNTLMIDIFKLEKEIKNKGYLNMVDDMGVSKRVAVLDYSISRMEGSLYKYQVDITVNKVDRGVN